MLADISSPAKTSPQALVPRTIITAERKYLSYGRPSIHVRVAWLIIQYNLTLKILPGSYRKPVAAIIQ